MRPHLSKQKQKSKTKKKAKRTRRRVQRMLIGKGNVCSRSVPRQFPLLVHSHRLGVPRMSQRRGGIIWLTLYVPAAPAAAETCPSSWRTCQLFLHCFVFCVGVSWMVYDSTCPSRSAPVLVFLSPKNSWLSIIWHEVVESHFLGRVYRRVYTLCMGQQRGTIPLLSPKSLYPRYACSRLTHLKTCLHATHPAWLISGQYPTLCPGLFYLLTNHSTWCKLHARLSDARDY